MRRLITLFSAISLFSSSVSTIVACRVDKGKKLEVNFENIPLKQTINTDPLYDYVYNDYYQYNTDFLYKPLTAFMQLAANKIKIDRNALENESSAAKDFYNSNVYKSGNYTSINYNVDKKINRPFDYKDGNGTPLVVGLTDDDISKQQYFRYWYVAYDSAEKAQKSSSITHKTSIIAPKINDFIENKNKSIIKKGWIHLFFTIEDSNINKTFKIDFNIQFNVTFKLYLDKNNKEIVIMAKDTFDKPLGHVNIRHPDKIIHERIHNMSFSIIK